MIFADDNDVIMPGMDDVSIFISAMVLKNNYIMIYN
jgi:hypothetical protein